MGDQLTQVQARARALAQSGKFVGWRAVAFELRFEPGYEDASEWLLSPATKEEIDLLCQRARDGSKRRSPEAA
jgi:hypothetical protein